MKCDAKQLFPAPCSRCAKQHLTCLIDPSFQRTEKRKCGNTAMVERLQADLDQTPECTRTRTECHESGGVHFSPARSQRRRCSTFYTNSISFTRSWTTCGKHGGRLRAPSPSNNGDFQPTEHCGSAAHRPRHCEHPELVSYHLSVSLRAILNQPCIASSTIITQNSQFFPAQHYSLKNTTQTRSSSGP